MQLAMADIDPDHPLDPMTEQTIGEPTGRQADIERNQPD
jgi:hypothetical protein